MVKAKRKRKRKTKKRATRAPGISGIDRLMFTLFDYRYVYLIRTDANNRIKVGIGYKLEQRERQIDRSIKGSREYVWFAVKLFFAGWHERRIHGKIESLNRPWIGSGKTEWHGAPWFWRIIPGGALLHGWVLRERLRMILAYYLIRQFFGILLMMFLGGLLILSGLAISQGGQDPAEVANNILSTIKNIIQ